MTSKPPDKTDHGTVDRGDRVINAMEGIFMMGKREGNDEIESDTDNDISRVLSLEREVAIRPRQAGVRPRLGK